MIETRIPEAYPYLRIAKQYGVDYSDVLAYADWLTHVRNMRDYEGTRERLGSAVRSEIKNAVGTFLRIRAGKIDWQTGETLC